MKTYLSIQTCFRHSHSMLGQAIKLCVLLLQEEGTERQPSLKTTICSSGFPPEEGDITKRIPPSGYVYANLHVKLISSADCYSKTGF